jgi:phage terminase small subunit
MQLSTSFRPKPLLELRVCASVPGSNQNPTMSHLEPPKHLKPTTADWWSSVCGDYELEAHHRRLLTLAAETWHRCQGAREALAEHGTVYTDRFGAPRARPEVAIERDSRTAFARLLRELSLDVEPPPEASRPPRRPGTGG